MILVLSLIAIAAIASTVFLGTRTHAIARVHQKIRTPRSTTPVPAVMYFERYKPKTTSGQGDAL